LIRISAVLFSSLQSKDGGDGHKENGSNNGGTGATTVDEVGSTAWCSSSLDEVVSRAQLAVTSTAVLVDLRAVLGLAVSEVNESLGLAVGKSGVSKANLGGSVARALFGGGATSLFGDVAGSLGGRGGSSAHSSIAIVSSSAIVVSDASSANGNGVPGNASSLNARGSSVALGGAGGTNSGEGNTGEVEVSGGELASGTGSTVHGVVCSSGNTGSTDGNGSGISSADTSASNVAERINWAACSAQSSALVAYIHVAKASSVGESGE